MHFGALRILVPFQLRDGYTRLCKLSREMAQKAVAGDSNSNRNAIGGEKISADDQENFIKNLLIRCKSELSDTNDGALNLLLENTAVAFKMSTLFTS